MRRKIKDICKKHMQVDEAIEIVWSERFGPAVVTPSRRSFGSKLIERSLDSFGGSAELTFEPAGVVCRITLPRAQASVRGGAAKAVG